MLLSMNEGGRFRFTKEERITGAKRIETLFAQGDSLMAYPFRVVHLRSASPAKMTQSVLITVPKKRLKAAVDRNRIKRLFREAYRRNRHHLAGVLRPDDAPLDIAFIYVKDELSDYTTVEKGVSKAISALTQKIMKG